MNLLKLEIERQLWGTDKGQYVGKIQFDNELGLVAIKLTPEKCDELFRVCADGIVDTAKLAAKELTCTIIEHQKCLEESA